MFAIISKDSEYLWLNMLLLWGRCVDNSIKEKIGNICDLGTITNQFLSHRYLLLFFKKTENVQSGNKKCSKFLWHNQILPCWRKSQILATFDVTRSNPSMKKGSKYLWLWNCYLSVPKSQIFAIFWKSSEYLWLGNWLPGGSDPNKTKYIDRCRKIQRIQWWYSFLFQSQVTVMIFKKFNI